MFLYYVSNAAVRKFFHINTSWNFTKVPWIANKDKLRFWFQNSYPI